MDSVVNLCNIALVHLGDGATVSCLNPPEGSAQAEHCARFYPLARNALLETHPWNFAVREERLPRYQAAIPSLALRLRHAERRLDDSLSRRGAASQR